MIHFSDNIFNVLFKKNQNNIKTKMIFFIPTILPPKQPLAKPTPPQFIQQSNKKKAYRTQRTHEAKPLVGQDQTLINL